MEFTSGETSKTITSTDTSNFNQNRRTQAVKLADALNSIEGVPITDFAKKLSQLWVDGEITGEEMKETLLQHHHKIANQDH